MVRLVVEANVHRIGALLLKKNREKFFVKGRGTTAVLINEIKQEERERGKGGCIQKGE